MIDGAYADIEGRDIILTTNNGISDTNRIVLEPETMRNLSMWLIETQKLLSGGKG